MAARDNYTVRDMGYKTPCWVWNLSERMRHSCGPYQGYYRRAKGAPPKGLHLDHLCRVRACVNPDHLEPVTQAENNRRSIRVKGNGPQERYQRAQMEANCKTAWWDTPKVAK